MMRGTGRRKPAGIAVAALGLALLAWTPRVQAGQPVGPCQSHQVCRFAGPEDIVDLTGTDWTLVSAQGPADAGGLTGFDTVQGRIVPLDAAKAPASAVMDGDPACPRSPRLHNGGIDLVRDGEGYRLAVVNHDGADRIEFFRVALADGAPTLSWSGCAAAPAAYFLNDVALLPDGVAATHMFDRTMDKPTRDARLLKGLPTGFVARWSRDGGWRPIPHTEGAFPNGVAAAPDGAWIAFSETYGHVVNRIDADGGRRRRIPVAMQPDNLTLAGGGRVIVAGGTGAPMVSTQNCAALREPGCGFPGAAVEVDLNTGRTRPLATSDGAFVPGPSVALRKAGVLYLGTAYGDRITRLRPPARPQ